MVVMRTDIRQVIIYVMGISLLCLLSAPLGLAHNPIHNPPPPPSDQVGNPNPGPPPPLPRPGGSTTGIPGLAVPSTGAVTPGNGTPRPAKTRSAASSHRLVTWENWWARNRYQYLDLLITYEDLINFSEKTQSWCDKMMNQLGALHNKGRLQYRLYIQSGDTEIELARTEGF